MQGQDRAFENVFTRAQHENLLVAMGRPLSNNSRRRAKARALKDEAKAEETARAAQAAENSSEEIAVEDATRALIVPWEGDLADRTR